jgi:hypothetical protein
MRSRLRGGISTPRDNVNDGGRWSCALQMSHVVVVRAAGSPAVVRHDRAAGRPSCHVVRERPQQTRFVPYSRYPCFTRIQCVPRVRAARPFRPVAHRYRSRYISVVQRPMPSLPKHKSWGPFDFSYSSRHVSGPSGHLRFSKTIVDRPLMFTKS